MTAARSATAGFAIQTFTLTAGRSGLGTGTVTSSPAGINCGATCSASYNYNTVVTLTAAPAVGSLFTGWSGCDSVSGLTCTVTMSAGRSATAAFPIPTFPLTVTKGALVGRGTFISSPAG